MASYHQPYYRAYSYGTEGSAALAANPHRTGRTPPPPPPIGFAPKRQQAARAKSRARGLVVPRWMPIMLMVTLASVLLGMNGQLNERRHQLRAEILAQEGHLQDAQARIETLEFKLAEAEDETRIRSIAMNRLGMSPPAETQICRVPVPQVATDGQQNNWSPATEEISIVRTFIGAVGNLFKGQGSGLAGQTGAHDPQPAQQNPAWLTNPA